MMKNFAGIVLLLFAACGGGKPTEADYVSAASEIREKMCSKMEKCMDEMMAEVPENMRQMARAQFSKEKCMAVRPAPSAKPETFTREDLEKARACASAISSATCEQIKNEQVKGCEGLK